MMELATSSGAFENMAAASDMHPASYCKRTFGKHQSAAPSDLLQIAHDGLGHTPASDVDDGH